MEQIMKTIDVGKAITIEQLDVIQILDMFEII